MFEVHGGIKVARPREFDEAAVIRVMTLVFWERGYQSTSTRELEDATGLTTGSLYKAFGSKRAIFLRCVDQYMRERSYVSILRSMNDAPLEDALRAVMDAVIESAAENRSKTAGCLVTNIANELMQSEPDLGRDAAGRLAEMQTALNSRLRQAFDKGELGLKYEPETLGSSLMTILQGLLVMATTTRDIDGMRRTRDLALSLLRP